MIATAKLELVQMIDALVIAWPSRPVADAVNVVVPPDAMLKAVDGAIEIATGLLSGAVDPESPPQLAAVNDNANTRTIGRNARKRDLLPRGV
jgi:hypothetical protein